MWLFYLYALNITMFAWNLMLTQQTSIEFRLKISGRVKDYKVHKIKTKKKKIQLKMKSIALLWGNDKKSMSWDLTTLLK